MINRRRFMCGTATAGVALMSEAGLRGETPDPSALQRELEKGHDENVRRIQEWMRQPSIAAENRGMSEGCELTMRLLRDAGFDTVTRCPRKVIRECSRRSTRARRVRRHLLHVRRKTGGSVRWSSPPWDAALVDKPGLGKVLVGRGAVNKKDRKEHSWRRFTRSRAPAVNCR